MDALFQALQNLGEPVFSLIAALAALLFPWTPLAAWIAFWLFAVNWLRLRPILASGGWIGLVLIGLVMVLVWGVVDQPSGELADFFGLSISHFVEKTVYVSGLFCLMLLAGALQLSGFCAGCIRFEEPVQIADTHGHGDSHDHPSDHGHAAAHH